jgi:hypothetical protein
VARRAVLAIRRLGRLSRRFLRRLRLAFHLALLLLLLLLKLLLLLRVLLLQRLGLLLMLLLELLSPRLVGLFLGQLLMLEFLLSLNLLPLLLLSRAQLLLLLQFLTLEHRVRDARGRGPGRRRELVRMNRPRYDWIRSGNRRPRGRPVGARWRLGGGRA